MQENEERIKILLTEDNPADVFLVRESLKSRGLDVQLFIAEDGEKAIDFIDRVESGDEQTPRPELVLLDLNLPFRNGAEVLRHLRKTRAFEDTPVIIITSSNTRQDRETVRSMGVAEFFVKPLDLRAFMALGGIVRRVLDGQSARRCR